MEVTAKRRALGRGLGALNPHGEPLRDPSAATMIPLGAIRANPLQPRQSFAQPRIDELAESIRQKGILQPLLVRPVPGGYELIAGERRFRAAQRLGLEQGPVTVRDVDYGELLEIALIENIQREDLGPLEEARAYRRLLDEFALTQEQIATRVGKDRSTIANALRLLLLPPAVQADIENGVLSAGHARALAGAGADQTKVALAREVVAQRLSVRQTEQLAKRAARPLADAELRAAEQRLTETLGTRVRVVQRRKGGGKIEIEYYSLDELNGLIERLGSECAA